MLRATRTRPRYSGCFRGVHSTTKIVKELSSIDTIVGPLDGVNLNEFRQRAFIPEKPLLITAKQGPIFDSTVLNASNSSSIIAAAKWFSLERDDYGKFFSTPHFSLVPSQQYLAPFKDTTLPYELITPPSKKSLRIFRNWLDLQYDNEENKSLASYVSAVLEDLSKSDRTFHTFTAPLSLFLQACIYNSGPSQLRQLYIAQAQVADLPKQLQDDLPTPRPVMEAGKGDIYDANIWLGIAPTYTPLHKDPNPNLFVQLASRKKVRLFRPNTGTVIFREVQQKIDGTASFSFRGEEMMQGLERAVLDTSVWGPTVPSEGFEVTVGPGDALFIPKGWWHSIKSVGMDVTASVNWWFR